jgi:hypothetical protein
MTSVKLSNLIPPKFHDVWRASLNQNILHVVCEGGRGSGKSSDVAHIIIQLIMRYAVNAVCIRKTDNTLEQSVYEQLKWAISEQQVTHLFKFNKSPLRITYLPRGNYIVFRGAQYPERIKSLKDSQFPFAIGWIEELAELKLKMKSRLLLTHFYVVSSVVVFFISFSTHTTRRNENSHGLTRNMERSFNQLIHLFIIRLILIIHTSLRNSSKRLKPQKLGMSGVIAGNILARQLVLELFRLTTYVLKQYQMI